MTLQQFLTKWFIIHKGSLFIQKIFIHSFLNPCCSRLLGLFSVITCLAMKNCVLFPRKVNSNTIKLTVHTSCHFVVTYSVVMYSLQKFEPLFHRHKSNITGFVAALGFILFRILKLNEFNLKFLQKPFSGGHWFWFGSSGTYSMFQPVHAEIHALTMCNL